MTENQENEENKYICSLQQELSSLENYVTENVDVARVVAERIRDTKNELEFLEEMRNSPL
jgi:hypothetical protein